MNEFYGVGFAVAASACLSILPVVLLALAVPYTVIRLKAESPVDPQLGAKVVFQFFFSAGVLVALAGLTTLAVDWMTREARPPEEMENAIGRITIRELWEEGFNVTQRVGLGLLLSGLIVSAVHALLIQASSVAHRHRVRRTFVGWRFAIHGVIVMILLSVLLILILQQGAFKNPLVAAVRAVNAALLVWTTSWVIHLGLLLELARRVPRPATTLEGGNGKDASPSQPLVLPPLDTFMETATLTIFNDREADPLPVDVDADQPVKSPENKPEDKSS
jgi:hypothetical protein